MVPEKEQYGTFRMNATVHQMGELVLLYFHTGIRYPERYDYLEARGVRVFCTLSFILKTFRTRLIRPPYPYKK